VRSETRNPSRSNSPWILGARQRFSLAILRMRSRTSLATDERASPRRQSGELLAKGKILEQEIAARTEGRDEHPHRYRYESKHGEERLLCPIRNVNESLRDDVLANDIGLTVEVERR